MLRWRITWKYSRPSTLNRRGYNASPFLVVGTYQCRGLSLASAIVEYAKVQFLICAFVSWCLRVLGKRRQKLRWLGLCVLQPRSLSDALCLYIKFHLFIQLLSRGGCSLEKADKFVSVYLCQLAFADFVFCSLQMQAPGGVTSCYLLQLVNNVHC